LPGLDSNVSAWSRLTVATVAAEHLEDVEEHVDDVQVQLHARNTYMYIHTPALSARAEHLQDVEEHVDDVQVQLHARNHPAREIQLCRVQFRALG